MVNKEALKLKNTKTIRKYVVSTRVTLQVKEKAAAYLAKEGLSISEYMRLALAKAANNEVQLVNFLDTPEAKSAKQEAENDDTFTFSNADDFKGWVDSLNESTDN